MDVVIVGDGPAGCATAIALRAAGVEHVLLIGGPSATAPRVGENLPPSARGLLLRLGVSDRLLHEGHEPCHGSASAWGRESLSYNDHLRQPLGHGWHVDRDRLDTALLIEAMSRGVRWLSGTRVETIDREGLGFRVAGLDERVGLLVDATGAGARVASMLGAVRRTEDQLLFFYAQIEASEPGQRSMTLLEAEEGGWWYAACQPSGAVTAACAVDPDDVRTADLADPEVWGRRLARTRHASTLFTGAAREVFVRRATSSCLARVAGDGWLAVGDAASTWDPLAGQGVIKALDDGIRAADAIVATLRGDAGALHRYADDYAARFVAYRSVRARSYAAERRWCDRPFWRRRVDRSQDPALAAPWTELAPPPGVILVS